MPKLLTGRALWLLALFPLLGWWTYGLMDLDEGFYGAVVAEMNRRGEWITPFYSGEPWFEKPILLYWIAKPCLALFGEWVGPRLPSILATFATLGMLFVFAKRHFGTAAGPAAVLTLCAAPLFAITGRMMLTDPLLVACLTGAFLTFWESLVGAPKWRLATAALLGLSILAKGPVGAGLFAIVALWTYVRQPALRPRYRGYWGVGTLLLFGLIATWYGPAYLANGERFVSEFLIEQNLGRFAGGDQAHRVPGLLPNLLFYVPILFLGLLPWGFWLPAAWPRRSADPLLRYLAAWAITVFAFFTLSGTKLPHYILPALPPLALLLARYWSLRLETGRAKRWPWIAAGWVGAFSLFLWIAFPLYDRMDHAEIHRLALVAREQPGEVAIYQMGRREDRPPSGLKLNEVTHPSLLLYLNRDPLETDVFETLLVAKTPLWILTRKGRMLPEDFQAAREKGLRLEEMRPIPPKHYRLYRLAPE